MAPKTTNSHTPKSTSLGSPTGATDIGADVAIVGGGLAGCLTAIRLANAKPNLKIVLIEESALLGGQKTWFFRESDLSAESLDWVKALVEKTWTSSDVSFPRQQRTLPGNSYAFRSDHLHAYVVKRLAENVLLNARAMRISESHVELGDGRIVSARCVIDARGFSNDLLTSKFHCGFRKLISREFQLQKPHGVQNPLIIDANVPQMDGLRFFRIIPWDENHLVVEENYYSDNSHLNAERIARSLTSYVERQGWKIEKTLREETGAQVIPMTSEYLLSSVGGEPLPIGYRGGYFHAMTGENLPDAVRIADFLASLDDTTTQTARDAMIRFRRGWLSRQSFYRLINRIMFYASEPALRYQLLSNLYQQPLDVIERFLGSRSTWSDRLRILKVRPQLPLDRTLRSLTEKSVAHWPTVTAKGAATGAANNTAAANSTESAQQPTES